MLLPVLTTEYGTSLPLSIAVEHLFVKSTAHVGGQINLRATSRLELSILNVGWDFFSLLFLSFFFLSCIFIDATYRQEMWWGVMVVTY